jgi:hypothetical protein
MVSRFTKWTPAAVAVALLTLGAACSDDDSSDGGTPTPSVCDRRDAVEVAVANVADIDVLAEGTDALKAAVDDLETEVSALKEAVSEDLQDEVDAMETAASDAGDTLDEIDSEATLNEKIDDLQAALTGIATTSADLLTALDQEC